MYDGRFANNGWLQETPDPLTKLVWDNAALISRRTPTRLGVDDRRHDHASTAGGQSLEIAVVRAAGPAGRRGRRCRWVMAARPRGTIGDELGFNTYALRTAAAPYVVAGVTGHQDRRRLRAGDDAGPSHHRHRRPRPAARSASARRARAARSFAKPRSPSTRKTPSRSTREAAATSRSSCSSRRSKFNDTHAWGMAIDMNTCIGCNACVVACQAENNIPVVGKEQVLQPPRDELDPHRPLLQGRCRRPRASKWSTSR